MLSASSKPTHREQQIADLCVALFEGGIAITQETMAAAFQRADEITKERRLQELLAIRA